MTGHGFVYGHIGVVETIYRFNDKHALHIDGQYLYTKQDEGKWFAINAEYTIAPFWFFSLSEQINFDNPKHKKQRHFYLGSIAYANKGTRVQIGYARQPQGVMCIGGVCRNVPASNGFIVSISSTF